MVDEKSAPAPAPAPAPPAKNAESADFVPLAPRQLASLRGIVDGLLPSQKAPPCPPQANAEAHKRFWEHSLTSDEQYMKLLEISIQQKLPPTECFLLGCLLYVLSTVLGSAFLFAKNPFALTSFSQWKPEEQTAALLRLQTSRFKEKRTLFNGVKKLVCALALSFVYENNEQDKKKNSKPQQDKDMLNPYWSACGYPGPPQSNMSAEEDARKMKEGGAPDLSCSLIDITTERKLICDVVIVGSGAGGGVAAATLEAKGYTVIIVEKGSYVKPSEVTNLESEAMDKMYENHSLLTTTDGNISILAGSTLGGATSINWGCCLPLPDHVRKEWVQKHKLRQFEAGQEFDMAMEAVVDRIGCRDKSKVVHNTMNKMFQKGCDGMGFKWETCGQNLRDTKDDSTGYICFGDRYTNKQSGLSTFLADAVKCGAQIIQNCEVDQVIQGLYLSPTGKRRRKANGIIGYVGGNKVTIQAKKAVIVAAGALNTPRILYRSWLRSRHLGRHLHLHPVAVTFGCYDKPINAYLGAPMSTVCNEFELGPKQDGYGAKTETPSCHSGLATVGIPFLSPKDFKEALLRLKNTLPLIFLQRDIGEGSIRLGIDELKVDYTLNPADKRSLLFSLKEGIKMLIASGARQIRTTDAEDPSLSLSDSQLKKLRCRDNIENDPCVQQYLDGVESRGTVKDLGVVLSAHQMGSCRMGITSDRGAVDENGEAWECDDLFVFDTSVFPTASGANPMLTVFAISRMLSTRLLIRFMQEDEKLKDNPELSRAIYILRLARLRISQKTRSSSLQLGHLLFFGVVFTLIVYTKFFFNANVALTQQLFGPEL